MIDCPKKQAVLVAIYPDKTTGVPTVSVIDGEKHATDSLKLLNEKLISCDLLQCEKVHVSSDHGICYLMYTFAERPMDDTPGGEGRVLT
jgi:hypothetical protein